MEMKNVANSKFLPHQCQHCGSESKWVETLIDDEFSYNESTGEYEAVWFGDNFSHTGKETCVECNRPWTGA